MTSFKSSVSYIDSETLLELFTFQGSRPLTENLISRLMLKGWRSSVFEKVAQNSPRCDAGHFIAFYSKKRNSILFPQSIEEFSPTVEIEKNGITHYHSLPSILAH